MPQRAHEEEQGRVLGDPDQHDRGNVVDAMRERGEQCDGHEAEIDSDERPVLHDPELA